MITYKFCPASRSSFFDDRRLRFSQPTALNDPHERLHLIEDFSPDEVIEAAISRRMSHLLAVLSAQFPGAGPDVWASIINKAKSDLSHDINQNREGFATITQRRIRKHIDDVVGILSLSKNWNVKLLWSHYAEAY